jgi:hypothetical protein
MTATFLRRLGLALLAFAPWQGPAIAQFFPQQPAGPPQSQICLRLESQLTAFDRGSADPARAEQIRRYEDAAAKQQFELDRLVAQSRRIGCENFGLFALFTGQPAQCGPLNAQIRQMRANLDRILADLERVRGGSADREMQRRSILAALGQHDCGPQYRAAVQGAQRGFFDQLFGGNTIVTPGDSTMQSSTFRTLCVRTCDGFYFPISYSTVPGKFHDDERICQRQCPAAEVILFSHRNPGEDVMQAVSIGGRQYTELPNAFRYRREFNPSCSCRQPGQSWGDALKNLDDRTTLDRGDIVVTEERAKVMSQPRDAQGRPLRAPARSGKPDPQPPATEATPTAADANPSEDSPPAKRPVRSVGPAFYPVR